MWTLPWVLNQKGKIDAIRLRCCRVGRFSTIYGELALVARGVACLIVVDACLDGIVRNILVPDHCAIAGSSSSLAICSGVPLIWHGGSTCVDCYSPYDAPVPGDMYIGLPA